MAATYVTKAELRTNLGIGALYTDAVVEEVCQSAEDIIKAKLWFNTANVIAHSAVGTTATIYLDSITTDRFYVGQVVTVANVAAHFDGSATLTEVNDYDISFVDAQVTTTTKHKVIPYGSVTIASSVDYATVPAVREASMLIAVDIWQSRQMS